MKTKIEKAIRETLVIENKESIYIAVEKICKLVNVRLSLFNDQMIDIKAIKVHGKDGDCGEGECGFVNGATWVRDTLLSEFNELNKNIK